MRHTNSSFHKTLKKKKISKSRKVLITGSAGLIGSEAVTYFIKLGFEVYGIDNDMRSYFFGAEASTKWNRERLKKMFKDKYVHLSFDIRDRNELKKLFHDHLFDIIIHTAAQPSHDWAAKEPITDFEVNALGTLNLLECFRLYCPHASFIFTSTNKAYGDTPNSLPFIEQETRFELPKEHLFYRGINETMSIDNSVHSVFGASKVAADIMVQEYGKYFGLHTVVFRGGCLTGPAHSGTKLHGFLAYLVKCIIIDEPYTIFGYKGKQVRDNIHANDLIQAFCEYVKKPTSGEAYNIGGSRFSNTSVREAITAIEHMLHKKAKIQYVKDNRIGDHIWYISDISKFQGDYPSFHLQYSNEIIIEDICRHGHFD